MAAKKASPKAGMLKPLPARKVPRPATVDNQKPLGSPPTGRPVSNVGKYLIKPTADDLSGFEMINGDPEILRQVHQRYLKEGKMPDALRPKYIQKPEVMEHGVLGRGKAISRGWRKPRSQQG